MTWTDEHDQFLREHYDTLTAKRIARVLGRNPGEIYKRAYALGLGCRKEWTREEDIVIRLMYFRGADACLRFIRDRTRGSIWARAWRLGLATKREEWDDD